MGMAFAINRKSLSVGIREADAAASPGIQHAAGNAIKEVRIKCRRWIWMDSLLIKFADSLPKRQDRIKPAMEKKVEKNLFRLSPRRYPIL